MTDFNMADLLHKDWNDRLLNKTILERSAFGINGPTRYALILSKNNIQTVAQLISTPVEVLLQFHGLGDVHFSELEEGLARLGLELQKSRYYTNYKKERAVRLKREELVAIRIEKEREKEREREREIEDRIWKSVRKDQKVKEIEIILNLLEADRFSDEEIERYTGFSLRDIQGIRKRLEILNRPASSLGLSTRVLNCFRYADIRTIEDLLGYSKQDLQKYRNFGKLSVAEIDEKLAPLGLDLSNEGYGRYSLLKLYSNL